MVAIGTPTEMPTVLPLLPEGDGLVERFADGMEDEKVLALALTPVLLHIRLAGVDMKHLAQGREGCELI
jgi:hypothetical protein